jgi:hypothetical protein
MVEEMPNPSINAPRVMIAAVCIGASSSFIFLICLLFSIKDVDMVNSSSAGALLESMYQATGSRAGAVCLQVSCLDIHSSTSILRVADLREGLPYYRNGIHGSSSHVRFLPNVLFVRPGPRSTILSLLLYHEQERSTNPLGAAQHALRSGLWVYLPRKQYCPQRHLV